MSQGRSITYLECQTEKGRLIVVVVVVLRCGCGFKMEANILRDAFWLPNLEISRYNVSAAGIDSIQQTVYLIVFIVNILNCFFPLLVGVNNAFLLQRHRKPNGYCRDLRQFVCLFVRPSVHMSSIFLAITL